MSAGPGSEPIGRWYGRRGNIHVGTTLRVIASDAKRRIERLRISVLVRDLTGVHHANGKAQNGMAQNGKSRSNGVAKKISSGKIVGRLRDEFDYRFYSAAQIRKLFASVPQLELLEIYNFWYNLDDPQKLDNELSDAVFILRRR